MPTRILSWKWKLPEYLSSEVMRWGMLQVHLSNHTTVINLSTSKIVRFICNHVIHQKTTRAYHCVSWNTVYNLLNAQELQKMCHHDPSSVQVLSL